MSLVNQQKSEDVELRVIRHIPDEQGKPTRSEEITIAASDIERITLIPDESGRASVQLGTHNDPIILSGDFSALSPFIASVHEIASSPEVAIKGDLSFLNGRGRLLAITQ